MVVFWRHKANANVSEYMLVLALCLMLLAAAVVIDTHQTKEKAARITFGWSLVMRKLQSLMFTAATAAWDALSNFLAVDVKLGWVFARPINIAQPYQTVLRS